MSRWQGARKPYSKGLCRTACTVSTCVVCNVGGMYLDTTSAMISDVIGAHSEYHAIVSDAHAALAFEPNVSRDAENPFLHMGLHLAVREQVSIDRPPGVRELHRLLQARYGDLHRAEHALMEALGEALWQAQRAGKPPDEAYYLALARRRLETSGGP